MAFLNPEFWLLKIGFDELTGLAWLVGWVLSIMVLVLGVLFLMTLMRRFSRRFSRRNDPLFRERIQNKLRQHQKIEWSDFSWRSRLLYRLGIKKGQLYFFRRILVDEAIRAQSFEDQHRLFVYYSAFGFLELDLRLLKSFFWFKRLASIIRLEAFHEPELVGPFLERLEDKNDLIALVALRALSRFDFPEKAQKLLDHLSRRAPSRRDVFAEILTNVGRDYKDQLIEIVQTCYDPYIAAIGISVLGNLKVNDAKPLCIMLLRSSDDDVVSEAVLALQNIGGADSIPALRALVSHDSEKVRARVLIALRALGDQKWFEVAHEFMKDRSPHVRRIAFDFVKQNIQYV